MRRRWVGVLAKVLLILMVGLPVVEGIAAGQDDQDRPARIHQKMERLNALVQQRQQEGANLQLVGDLTQGFPALMEQQKFVEAEALADRALELVNKLGVPAQAGGTPPSLQGKMKCLQGQVQKWQQEGKDLQPIGEIMQDFQPLLEQQKFTEAERVVDRALKLVGEACPDQPASAPGVVPPVSLQEKMQRLQALINQGEQAGANLQPVSELMQGFEALMQQKKFSEAEALADRALEFVNKLAPPVQAAGPPPSLQRKMQCLQEQVQKWQQEGKDPQPIGEIMQDFQPLLEQQKFTEAERVVDRALKLVGEACPDQPASAPGAVPPVSLQEKMQRLQALVNQREQAGANLQPLGELMQGFEALMQQKKFSEAEALVDRALKLLGESAQPNQSPGSDEASWIAYGASDADGRQQIFVVKSDGTGKKRLTQEGKQNFFPAWSPDGKRLAFTSDRSGSLQIWIMEADGSNPKQLTTEGESIVPTWSPDGKRLAFGSKRSGHFEIWAMYVDGSHQEQLTKTDAAVRNNAAAWSPDGRRIAFSSTRSGHYAIWVMDPDGGHLAQLTTPYGDRYPDSNVPAWSPDGTKIAFWSGLEHRYGNVWVMDADGSNRKQLTDQPPGINCDEPAWSGDGRKIMFGSNRPGSKGIGNWIMDADGSNQRVLTTNISMRGRPSWQPRHRAPSL